MSASEAAARPCNGTLIIWEEWVTQGPNPCPECSSLDGKWFLADEGPHPPLHPNCRCARIVVYVECISRPPDQAPSGSRPPDQAPEGSRPPEQWPGGIRRVTGTLL